MVKDNYITFSDAKIGDYISRPVLVATVADNVARNGNPFVKITLKDGYTDAVATMFDVTAATLKERGIYGDAVVDVKLAVNNYQGTKSFRIVDIRPTEDPSLSINDFVRVPPVDLQQMYDEICDTITASKSGSDDESLADLALRILADYKHAYMTSSAAVSMHHNLRGGLLYHSYRMVKAADALCNVYTSLNRELLVCGAALHDIGKIWEYKTSPAGEAEFTPSGVLFGHLYLGASLIKSYTVDHHYNNEKVLMLIHLILSHHGTQEFGAVATPATAEAYALHYIDNLDAKIYVCEEQYSMLSSGELSEKKPFGMENRIYKPGFLE